MNASAPELMQIFPESIVVPVVMRFALTQSLLLLLRTCTIHKRGSEHMCRPANIACSEEDAHSLHSVDKGKILDNSK